jgi:hypothetical protein
MRGLPTPIKPPNRRGHIPLVAPPDVSFGCGAAPKKRSLFLNNISQTKTSVGALNKAFFHHWRQQKRWGEKGVKRRVYHVMG